MSKNELIAGVAASGEVSVSEARRMVDLVLREIEAGLRRRAEEGWPDGKYVIGSFGTFVVTRSPARQGRNPRTGEKISIPAGQRLKFRPSASLREAARA